MQKYKLNIILLIAGIFVFFGFTESAQATHLEFTCHQFQYFNDSCIAPPAFTFNFCDNDGSEDTGLVCMPDPIEGGESFIIGCSSCSFGCDDATHFCALPPTPIPTSTPPPPTPTTVLTPTPTIACLQCGSTCGVSCPGAGTCSPTQVCCEDICVGDFVCVPSGTCIAPTPGPSPTPVPTGTPAPTPPAGTGTPIPTPAPSCAGEGEVCDTMLCCTGQGLFCDDESVCTLDTTPPAVSASHSPSSPKDNCSMTITATASDPETGIKTVSIAIEKKENGVFNRVEDFLCNSSPCVYSRILPEGEYRYLYTARNGADKDSLTQLTNFTVTETAGTLQCVEATGCTCTKVATAIGDIDVDPAKFVSRIMSLLLGLAGGIAVILIIAAGYSFMVSRDNPQAVQDARERILAAVVGLLFVIFSLVILEVIGVDILQIPGFGR